MCANGDISPMLKTVYDIRPHRIPLADEEKQIAWGLAAVKMPDGSLQPAYFQTANTKPMAEMFKIKSGKTRDILGFGTIMPCGIGDGFLWSCFQIELPECMQFLLIYCRLPRSTLDLEGTGGRREDGSARAIGHARCLRGGICLPGMTYAKILIPPFAHAKIAIAPRRRVSKRPYMILIT